MKNAGLLFALLSFSVVLAQDKHSFVGAWKLDVTQSQFAAGDTPPKSVSGRISAETPKMFSYHAHGVDDKGKTFSESWSGPEDGSMHPVMENGKPSGQQSVVKEQDGTLVWQGEGFPDGSSFKGHMYLSPDGNTATEDLTIKSKDGKESKAKQVWHRVGG
jgi:hypothetical protein